MQSESAFYSQAPQVLNGRNRYSDVIRTETLLIYDGCRSLTLTSKQTGIPLSTVKTWVDGRCIHESISKLRSENAIPLADKLEGIAHKAADLLPKKLNKASVRDLLGAVHITVPAMQLLRGQPTSITANVERKELTVILEEGLSQVIDVLPAED